MKLALALGAVLLVCAVVSASTTEKSATTPSGASKDVKDAIKKAKEAKEAKKDCLKACTSQYEPVCAHDPKNPSAKPRSFGSECVLQNHNCENGVHLILKQKGECPNSDGVRLS